MGKPSAPPAPDYTGAAQQTAQGNLDVAKYTTQANRVNQNNPYGSISYTKSPSTQTDTAGYEAALALYNKNNGAGNNAAAPSIKDYQTTSDNWTMNQSLSPEQQALFDQNQQTNKTLGDVAQQGLGYVQGAMNSPLQQQIGLSSGVNAPQLQMGIYDNSGQIQTNAGDPQLLQQQVSNAMYGQQTQYLDPQFQQSQQALESQLANQGITRGSEAYNTAINNASLQKQRAYGDARQTAIGQGVSAAQGMYGQQLAGMQAGNQAVGQQFGQGLQTAQFGNQAGLQQFGMGMQNANLQNQASAQQLQQDQTLRNDPVNMLNAVRTGQQMQVAQMPQQQNVAQMGQVAGPDYMGAAQGQAQYNQGLYNAQSQANANMYSGLFGLGGAGIMKYSDRRLKKNIVKIGKSAKGYGLYVWEYLWGEISCGVMADEIEKIMPEAVSLHPSGFKMVNYSMLGA